MLRVAIVGSRDFSSLAAVERYVTSLAPSTIIVSGDDQGVDRLAESAALAHGLKTLIFVTDWTTDGEHAKQVRNDQILANTDEVVAFWDGKSPGTEELIRKARTKKKPVLIFRTSSATPMDRAEQNREQW